MNDSFELPSPHVAAEETLAAPEVRAVELFRERCEAWTIVHRKYRDSKFIPGNASGMHLSVSDLLPSSATWIAKVEGQTVGTMSAVFRSAAGLPCGLSYESDLQSLGIDGRLLCEFTKLAAIGTPTRSHHISLQIVGAMVQWCKTANVDDIICVVHPRHVQPWTRLFGWRPLSSVKSHSGVNGNPGVLMHIDLRANHQSGAMIPEKGTRVMDSFRDSAINLHGGRLSGSELATVFLQRPDLFINCCSAQRWLLSKHYPWISEIIFRVLYSRSTGWHTGHSLPGDRPQRERSFEIANKLALTRLQQDMPLSEEIRDQLMILDSPLVLLIQESAQLHYRIREVLESQNFIVVSAANFQEARELLQQHVFDFVVQASHLEEHHAWALGEFVRILDNNRGVHTPIISVSNFFAHLAKLTSHAVSAEFLPPLFSCLQTIAKLMHFATWEAQNDQPGEPDLALVVNG